MNGQMKNQVMIYQVGNTSTSRASADDMEVAPSSGLSDTDLTHAVTKEKGGSGIPEISEPTEWVHEAPDGGMTAWLVILGNWCTSFCSFGWVNSMSYVIPSKLAPNTDEV